MESNSLLLELLIAGFFAIACFRTRAAPMGSNAIRPWNLLQLTSRLERMRKTRWQWCSMVLVLVLVRLQSGLPLVVEVTAALQFVIFLALPARKQCQVVAKEKTARRLVRADIRQLGGAKTS